MTGYHDLPAARRATTMTDTLTPDHLWTANDQPPATATTLPALIRRMREQWDDSTEPEQWSFRATKWSVHPPGRTAGGTVACTVTETVAAILERTQQTARLTDKQVDDWYEQLDCAAVTEAATVLLEQINRRQPHRYPYERVGFYDVVIAGREWVAEQRYSTVHLSGRL